MTPPCLNSWSGSDSQSSTPPYWSSAMSSASTFNTIYHPVLQWFLSLTLYFTFFSSPFLLSCLFCSFCSHLSFTPTLCSSSLFAHFPPSPGVMPRGTTSPCFSSVSLFFALSICLFIPSPLCLSLSPSHSLSFLLCLSLHLAVSHSSAGKAESRWDSVKQCHLPAHPAQKAAL